MPSRTDIPATPAPLRVVLVDDEAAASRWLAELLSRYSHVKILGRARRAAQAKKLIARVKPDAVFIDVEMPGRDGLTVLDRLPEEIYGVVVTAFEEYALEAFETAAFDYLLKPVTAARLDRTLARLATIGQRMITPAPQQSPPPHESPTTASRIILPLAGETSMVPATDILWVESQEHYTQVHAIDRSPRVVRRPLVRWESELPAASFLRVSRSLLVGLERITMVRWQWQGGTEIEFAGSHEILTLGRAATRRLKEHLDAAVAP